MRPKRIGTRSASRPSFWASRISTAPRRRSAESTTPSPRRGARSRASRPTPRRLLGDVLAELVAASGPRCPNPPGSLTRLTESDGTRPPSHTVRGPFHSVPTPSGRRLPRRRLRRPHRAACDAILWRRIRAVPEWPGAHRRRDYATHYRPPRSALEGRVRDGRSRRSSAVNPYVHGRWFVGADRETGPPVSAHAGTGDCASRGRDDFHLRTRNTGYEAAAYGVLSGAPAGRRRSAPDRDGVIARLSSRRIVRPTVRQVWGRWRFARHGSRWIPSRLTSFTGKRTCD